MRNLIFGALESYSGNGEWPPRVFTDTHGTDGAFRHTQNDFRRPGHPSDAFEACLLEEGRDRDTRCTPRAAPDNKGLYALANDRQDSRKDLPRKSKISDRETSLTRFQDQRQAQHRGERGKTNIEGEVEREAGLDTSKRVHPDLELGAPNTPLGTPSDSERELFE